MLLHLCQPAEPRLEELGRAKPNGGVTFLGVDEVSNLLLFFLSLAGTHDEL